MTVIKNLLGSTAMAYIVATVIALLASGLGYKLIKVNVTKGLLQTKLQLTETQLTTVTTERNTYFIEKSILKKTIEEERKRVEYAGRVERALLDKVKELTDLSIELEDKINDYAKTPIGTQCKLDTEWVLLHNQAAGSATDNLPKGNNTGSTENTTTTTEDPVTKADALKVINVNYRQYRALSDRYLSLLDVCSSQAEFTFGD